MKNRLRNATLPFIKIPPPFLSDRFHFDLTYDKFVVFEMPDTRRFQPFARSNLPFTDRHYPMETFSYTKRFQTNSRIYICAR